MSSQRWLSMLGSKVVKLPGCSRKENCPARRWLQDQLANEINGSNAGKRTTPQRWHGFPDRETVSCHAHQKPEDALSCYLLVRPGLQRRSFARMRVAREGRGFPPSGTSLSPGGFIRGVEQRERRIRERGPGIR